MTMEEKDEENEAEEANIFSMERLLIDARI